MYFTTDSTWNQTGIFFSMVFVGMVIGIIYMFFNEKKHYIKKKYFKFILDIFFCLILFVILSITLYIVNNGNIKIYMVFSLFCGFIVSKWFFGEAVHIIVEKMNKVSKFFKKILRKYNI